MGSDEEYLDDLLKSIMEGEEESNHLTSEEEEDSTDIIEADESQATSDFDFAIEDFGVEEPMPEDMDEEMAEDGKDSGTADDFFLNDFAIQEPDTDDISLEDMHLEDIDDADDYTEESDVSDAGGVISPNEIDEMFAASDIVSGGTNAEGMYDSSEEADFAEMNGLLNSGSGDTVNDDMLALLESMSADIEEAENNNISADSINAGETDATDGEATETEDKREKKGFLSKFFGGKKKNNEQEQASEEEPELIDIEENMDFDVKPLGEQPLKKQNFFAKLVTFLTEADDEGTENDKLKESHGMAPSDENRNILEELDAEDKKKKKKKVKGKKEEISDDFDEDETETAKISKSKGKKKKEKADKIEIEPVSNKKQGKKISKKNIAIITGLCLTLTAVVVVLCSVVPEFFDKRKARDAYYASDFSQSYELLYDKKLDNSDTIIYNKSKIILEVNRKLDSYHNYMSMGKEVQALDALMSGVERYPAILKEAEQYHVTQEVNAIYETILNILNDKYGISEAVAKTIVAYEDDLTYTRKVESIVYKTPFVMPGEEAETAVAAVTDILPEEQSLMEESVLPEPEATPVTTTDSDREGTNSIVLEDELPLSTGEDTAQEQVKVTVSETKSESTETAADNETIPEENAGNLIGQGELIQGIRQPLDVEIHGN